MGKAQKSAEEGLSALLPASQQAPNLGLKLTLKHCMALVRSLFLFGISKGDSS